MTNEYKRKSHILHRENMTRTREEIDKVLKELGYELIEEINSRKGNKRVIVKDSIGYNYEVQLIHLINKNIPNIVDKRYPRLSLENIKLWLYLNKSKFELCDNNIYVDANTHLRFYHRVCKEEFSMSWSNISNKKGCPICDGRQIGKYNTLAYKFPKIAKEWHPTKNGNLKPSDVSYASSKKVWWKCLQGHEYYSSIGNRTSSGINCKQCADLQKESVIATELKEWCEKTFKYVDIEHQHPLLRSPKNGILRYDIYIGKKESLNGIYVEVNGTQHYKKSKKFHITDEDFEYSKRLDRIKRKFARKYGVYVEVDLRKIKTIEKAIAYTIKAIK